MPPKKYYAVARGIRPGIYANWSEAKAQIDGFAGALYRGFPTRQEAEAWLKNPTHASRAASGGAGSAGAPQPPAVPDADHVVIYTDGGSSGNPGPGGYGVVQIVNGAMREFSGGFRRTTNNRMELMAVIVALRELDRRDLPVTVYSDSSYVVNGIAKGWAKKWRKNRWIKSDKKPAVNPDLWSELLDLIEPLKINFVWVRGHAGNRYNERCDELAVSSTRMDSLPEDRGYRP